MSGLWVDLIIILLATFAAASGYRHGAVASALALVGMVLGAIAGILLAPRVVEQMQNAGMRLLVGLGLILVLVLVGEVSGTILGRAARSTLRTHTARSVDSAIGSALQAIAVLVVAWLAAIPLMASPSPALSQAVDDSLVRRGIDAVAPDWMRELPNDFSALLEDSGLQDVISPFGRAQIRNVGPPSSSLIEAGLPERLHASVVKVESQAQACNKQIDGTGFVIGPRRIMTNAHVVAGATLVKIESTIGQFDARVVYFDPDTDVAVLAVPELPASVPVLQFSTDRPGTGEDALALGHPLGGPYTATAQRVRGPVTLRGDNIYRNKTVERPIFTVRGVIQQGNSGGPLVDGDGKVIGVVFGAAINPDDETGFVLSYDAVRRALEQAPNLTARVDTRQCAA